MKKFLGLAGIFAGALALAACGGQESDAGAADVDAAAEEGQTVDASIEAALAGEHRSDEERARDVYRNPKETLLFFGLEPDMTVVEIWPGPGWYSRVIAPVLKEGGGVFYAAQLPVSEEEPRFKSMLDAYFAEFGDTDVYGEVRASTFAPDEEIAPPGSADMVLTFRNVHNWVPGGRAEAAFAAFYEALKPGGVLGVVDHRADGTELPNDGSKGYLYTDDVIAMAQSAGFDFDTASEINANANDTKDHPFGVWTLPPVSRQSDVSGVEDPEFDGAKYKAIGESDRFTLKFRKPIAADGALIE